DEAMKIAVTISQMPTKAIGLTKRLLNEGTVNSLDEQLVREGEEQVAATRTYDFTEGVKAFLEKRKPEFRGE
ncbi:MAG TPA: 2-(1,2-epoxy-1,2-dihydrophenyl)acetyl-CoA isomerase, partial [Bacteroidia bacterium]|nr:2-(1,2-epoxy-1,2-dihydrophenyl)acetyl-CoA isomerase [Bacteroidia bacterium]